MNAKNPLLVALILAATGCAASVPAAAAPSTPASEAPGAAAESAPAPQTANARSASFPALPTAPAPAARSAGPTSAKTSAPPTSSKTAHDDPSILVVYDGDLSMMVDAGKVSSTIDRIIDVAESVGGHLAGRRDGSVSVRVPSARFHESLEKIAALGEVTHQSVSAEDVSEEYHDAEVRLQNLEATQKRLQEFLARSASMNDMLTVERELERVSMEIDRIEGRMRFLRDHAAFSTLTVGLSARPKPQPVLAVGPKTPPPAPPRILPLHAAWLDELGVPALVSN